MKKYEIYEDNGGGLYLCLLDNNGNCGAIFENWEYTNEPGILLDAIGQLNQDQEAYQVWDGDLLERLHDNGNDTLTIGSLYEEISSSDLIAWGTIGGELETIPADRIGFAGQKALNMETVCP